VGEPAIGKAARIACTVPLLVTLLVGAAESPAATLAAELARLLAEPGLPAPSEEHYRDELGRLAASAAPDLEALASAAAAPPLARRLAAIALDLKQHPERHRALERYRRTVGETAPIEGGLEPSLATMNHPPRPLAAHVSADYRLAWESYLLGTRLWQGKELAAKVLKALGPRESAEVLAVEFTRATRTFDPQHNQGWHERAIIFLLYALAEVPDAVVLMHLAEAYESTTTESPRANIVAILRQGGAWQPVIDRALADHSMRPHADFLHALRPDADAAPRGPARKP
jgi:hypothetical protein